MLSEVGFAYFFVAEDVIRGSFGNNMAFADDVGMLANIQCFADIMVGDQHTNTFISEVTNNVFDVVNRDGVNTSKRFVEQNKLWICG